MRLALNVHILEKDASEPTSISKPMNDYMKWKLSGGWDVFPPFTSYLWTHLVNIADDSFGYRIQETGQNELIWATWDI